MAIDGASRIDALQPLAGPQSPATEAPAATSPADTASFRRLLESLELLAKEHRQAPPLTNAGAVPEAMARADEGYSLAMDLRHRLEEAFRQRQ